MKITLSAGREFRYSVLTLFWTWPKPHRGLWNCYLWF